MFHNDFSYWAKAAIYWTEKAEYYFHFGMIQDMDRCIKQSEKCFLLRDECAGKVYVVSGRKGEGVCRKYDFAPQTA